MRELTQEQRVNEIAQMLSGADVSDAALQNARELLDLRRRNSNTLLKIYNERNNEYEN